MRKLVGALALLLLVGTACSGGGATGRKISIGPPGNAEEGRQATESTAAPLSASPATGTGSAANSGLRAGGGPVVVGRGAGTAGVGGFPIPNLFTSAEDLVGIYPDRIVMCTHAALSLAAVFNVNEQDLNVYWQYVNTELHGIYGRKVEMSYADDNYGNTPDDVRNAYESCKAKKPFILGGGIGFDQIPQVRTFAEQDHQLYIHHIAREDFTKKYSFSYLPSVESSGRLAAQWVLKAHADKIRNVGVIYRDSENWEPGHRTFKSELGKHGISPVADLPVQKSASVYSAQIKALSDADAKVVFVWENALTAIEIVKQAKQQGFTPQWLVFPFNLMTDTLKEDTVSPIPIEGIAMWPAYRPGDTSGSYAPYADEIKLFEAKHDRYGQGNKDDIVWMTWLAWHQIHQLLLDCGKDCTRNKIVGLLQSGVHKSILRGCPFDFRRNGHVGGFDANIFRAETKNGAAGWRNVELCEARF